MRCPELLGFETIGVEIENPFGRDYNDLPIDMVRQNLAADTSKSSSTSFLSCLTSTTFYQIRLRDIHSCIRIFRNEQGKE